MKEGRGLVELLVRRLQRADEAQAVERIDAAAGGGALAVPAAWNGLPGGLDAEAECVLERHIDARLKLARDELVRLVLCRGNVGRHEEREHGTFPHHEVGERDRERPLEVIVSPDDREGELVLHQTGREAGVGEVVSPPRPTDTTEGMLWSRRRDVAEDDLGDFGDDADPARQELHPQDASVAISETQGVVVAGAGDQDALLHSITDVRRLRPGVGHERDAGVSGRGDAPLAAADEEDGGEEELDEK